MVEEGKGVEPYDVILKAPFPNIEVLRWAPGTMGAPGLPGLRAIPDERPHWFTTDNRRLYVLQRAAAKLWPKKAGVKVDLLFAGDSELFKKYNSSTAGLFASISDSGVVSDVCEEVWDWMRAVTPRDGSVDSWP